jgi:Uma2 family endonuclease
MASQTTTKLTYEDYVKLPDDGNRYEIIDGELIVNPAPVPFHQLVVGEIWFALKSYFREHGGGKVLQSPIDVILEESGIVQPDLIVILDRRAEILGPKNVQGAPDLVVEVLSDGTRRYDERDKRQLYERSGVDEYWIVDPVLELVKIHRRSGDAFIRVAEISTETGGTITSPLLPGFSLDIAAVFQVSE